MPAASAVPPAHYGATWGDASIRLINFAESEPTKFLYVILPVLLVGLLTAYFVYIVIVAGPVKRHKAEYDVERQKARKSGKKGK